MFTKWFIILYADPVARLEVCQTYINSITIITTIIIITITIIIIIIIIIIFTLRFYINISA